MHKLCSRPRAVRTACFSSTARAILITVGVGVTTFLAGSHAWATQATYSASGLPYTYETAGVSPPQVREFTIEVTDDFIVDGMSVALNVFSSNVSKADFRIVSPQGTVV